MRPITPKFHPSLWSDADVEMLDAREKLAFIWGWTNSQVNCCGCCEYTKSRFEFETQLPLDILLSAVDKLPRSIKHFPDRKIIFYRKFIRHQYGTGDALRRNNIFKSIMATFNGITHEGLRLALMSDYPEIGRTHKKEPEAAVKVEEPVEEPSLIIDEPSRVNKVAQVLRARARDELEVTEFALKIGLPSTDGEWFWAKCEGCGWTNGGKPMKDWKMTMRAWSLAGYLPSKMKPSRMQQHEIATTPNLPMLS